jgi:hypothetical protein
MDSLISYWLSSAVLPDYHNQDYCLNYPNDNQYYYPNQRDYHNHGDYLNQRDCHNHGDYPNQRDYHNHGDYPNQHDYSDHNDSFEEGRCSTVEASICDSIRSILCIVDHSVRGGTRVFSTR